MRLSLFLVILPVISFSSLIFLNNYDHKGYIFSSEFMTFDFKGECRFGFSRVVDEYVPPDEDVDVYGDFPRSTLFFLSNGISIGSTNADVVVPDWVLKNPSDTTFLCRSIPVEFLSPSVVKILGNLSDVELGSFTSDVMKFIGEYWELPTEHTFKPGEIVSFAPRAPSIDFLEGSYPGVGAVVIPKVKDFSGYVYGWIVDGIVQSSSVLILKPGDHTVTLQATDTLGFSSHKSFHIRIEPFQTVVRKIRCELGVDGCQSITGSRYPGIYVLKSLKIYGDFTFVVDATDTSFPEISVKISGRSVVASAYDPNGASVSVFVNGRRSDTLVNGKALISVVAIDPYGNATLESTEVIKEPDVRKILGISSPFYVGWGM